MAPPPFVDSQTINPLQTFQSVPSPSPLFSNSFDLKEINRAARYIRTCQTDLCTGENTYKAPNATFECFSTKLIGSCQPHSYFKHLSSPSKRSLKRVDKKLLTVLQIVGLAPLPCLAMFLVAPRPRAWPTKGSASTHDREEGREKKMEKS